jgi:hypothetical protein
MARAGSTTGAPGPVVAWSWERAFAGLVFALPAGLVSLVDPTAGVPLAVGVLPVVMLPIPGPRRVRVLLLLIGVISGVSMFVGGVLAHLPTVVAATLLAAAVAGAAALSSVAPRGQLVLTLCVPLVAAGMSYDDLATSAGTLLLLAAGGTYAWLVSLLWPERESDDRPPRPASELVPYGVRLGVAAAVAYLVASALGLDHPGWAPAACLLVARPQHDLLELRGAGRVGSVLVGALAAALVLHLQPSDLVYALLAVGLLAATAATSSSRWYITPGFSTFFVFVLLLYDQPTQTAQKFNERVGETLLGVVLAYFAVWLIPALIRKAAPART